MLSGSRFDDGRHVGDPARLSRALGIRHALELVGHAREDLVVNPLAVEVNRPLDGIADLSADRALALLRGTRLRVLILLRHDITSR